MAFSSSLLGKEYPLAGGLTATPSHIRAYREALDWLMPHPASHAAQPAEDGAVPPGWLAAQALALQCAPLLDPAHTVDLMRFALVEYALCIEEPLLVGSSMALEARVADVQTYAGGDAMRVECHARIAESAGSAGSVAGTACLSASARFAVRGTRQKRAWLAERAISNEELATFRALPLIDEQRWQAPVERGARLAAALGDPNPIYADEDIARMAGLPGPLVPPFYLLCWVYEALAVQLGGASRIRALRASLDRPSLAGQPMTLEVRGREGQPLAFALWNPQGAALIRAGVAELSV